MFTRITLPYANNALEPQIDALTVETHYEKHHKTYTDKFNDLIKEAPELAGKSAEEILMHLDKAPEKIRKGLKNNGGGFYNHNLYFESMIPGGKKPSAKLEKKIKEDFGDMDTMLKKVFDAATTTLFGSGWAWLVLKDGKMDIVISANQDSPLQDGNPNILLPVDMWEHAYYLKYKNAKVDYVKEYYKVINWAKVEERLDKAR